jgi:hypothetical protein
MVQNYSRRSTSICKYTTIAKYIRKYEDDIKTYFLKDEFRRMMNYE